MNNPIAEYIKRAYDYDDIILTNDLKEKFPEIADGTIRQTLKRLSDKEHIVRADPGVYFKPNPNRILKKPVISISDIIYKKYIYEDDEVIGYFNGINFANKIGLTTQTASIEMIKSNAVSSKKRLIKINNNKIIVATPRVEVNLSNYKLLQIMDLLDDFEQHSELSLSEAEKNMRHYLGEIDLSLEEIEELVDEYPLATQVKFYKTGVFHEITQRERVL